MNRLQNIITDCLLFICGVLIGTFLQADPYNLLSGFPVIYIKYIIPSVLFIFAIAIIITRNKRIDI